MRVRRQYTGSVETIRVGWHFTYDEFETFKSFYEVSLENGSYDFTMVTYEPSTTPFKIKEVTRDLGFLSPYEFSSSDNLYVVSAELEIITETFIEVADPDRDVVPLINYFTDDPDPDHPDDNSCRHTAVLEWSWVEGDVLESAIDDSTDDSDWHTYLDPQLTEAELISGNAVILLNNDFDHDPHHRYITWYELELGNLSASHSGGSSYTDGKVSINSSGTWVRVFDWEDGTVLANVTEASVPAKASLFAAMRVQIAAVSGTPTEEQARRIEDYAAAIAGLSRWFRVVNNGVPRTTSVRIRVSRVAAPILLISGGVYDQHPDYSALEAEALEPSSNASRFYKPFSYRNNRWINGLETFIEPRVRREYYAHIGAEDVDADGLPVYQGDDFYNPPEWDGVPNTVSFLNPDPAAEIRWTRNGSDPQSEMQWPPVEYDGYSFNARIYSDDFSGVLKGRCFSGGCKSPMTVVVVDKRFRKLGGFKFNVHTASIATGAAITPDFVEGDFLNATLVTVCGFLGDGESGNSTSPQRRWLFFRKIANGHTNPGILYNNFVVGADAMFLNSVEEVVPPNMEDVPQLFETLVSRYVFNLTRPGFAANQTTPISGFHAAGESGSWGDSSSGYIAALQEEMETLSPNVTACGSVQAPNNLLLEVFDIRVSAYSSVEIFSDPGSFNNPVIPTEDGKFYEDWETYSDGETDAQTLDGGEGWSQNSGEEEWGFVAYNLPGIEDWESYPGADRNFPASPTSPSDEQFDHGEGWLSPWYFIDWEARTGGFDYWEDSIYEDGLFPTPGRNNGGAGWAPLSSGTTTQQHWNVIDYASVVHGFEDWEDYEDQTVQVTPTLAYKMEGPVNSAPSTGTMPEDRGGADLNYQNDLSGAVDTLSLVDGKFDSGLGMFNSLTPEANSGFVWISDSTLDLFGEAGWTFRLWVKADPAVWNLLIDADWSTGNGWQIYPENTTPPNDPDTLRMRIGGASGTSPSTEPEIPISLFTEAWNQLLIRHVSGDGIYIHINDGTPIYFAHSSALVVDASPRIQVGASNNDPAEQVRVDALAIWNHAFTAQEITDDWNGGDGVEPNGLDSGQAWEDAWKFITY